MTDVRHVARADGAVRQLHFAVLGPLEARVDGEVAALGGPKQRGVLAMLIAAGGHPVSVDALLVATYGDDARPGKATLHTFVSNLRRVLGDVILRQGDGYVLDCRNATIDARVFEERCALAKSVDDPERSAHTLRDALSLWRGHAYADIEANGRLDGEITRLDEMRLGALESRLDADLRAGRHREVVGELDALTTEQPFREALRALHMLALYRCGRQAEALRAYANTREVLVENLGIDPSPALRELEQQILAQDPGLLVSATPPIQRRAVLVADLDDVASHAPWERDSVFARRDDDLDAAASTEHGVRLAPRGTAGYVVFADAIAAVRAARAIVNDRTRVAIDVGDLEMHDDEPIGPPVARTARLVATAHPGQVLLSSAAHDALSESGETGWASESLGRFDIVGLDPGVHVYQLVGPGFESGFPPLRVDRLPPPVPDTVQRCVPGYELRQLIGVGQLGEVHRAYQPSVGREVAVRIFGRSMVSHPQFVRRFEVTSQRITRVEHPHLVALLDHWREPHCAVMVSRLLTGGHLGERIPPGGLEPAVALDIIATIASAVGSAHRHGVAHGRIRPENVLYDTEGNAYVADLGIDEICAGVVTFASSAYDAPERLGGTPATPESDVYSLGVLVAHLLTGSPPPADGALDVPAGAAAEVIRRATDADPRRRQQSLGEVLDDVRTAFSIAADPAQPLVATRNPYRGLEAFDQADAEDFFGRDRSVAEMLAVLERESLVLVVGPSGVGKSSAVKAGLLPALADGALAGSDHWLVTEMVPGREPFQSLAVALGRVATTDSTDVVGALASGRRPLGAVVDDLVPGHPGVIVVVDQLEELFTQTGDDVERRNFLEMMRELANTPGSAVRIVATLRADYFDRPLAYAGFDEAAHGRTIALGAMSPAELTEAVTRPAGALGVQFASAVVERIVAEATAQPGALPLAQHTLTELFDARTTNSIDHADLDRIGGVAGAIGRRADQIYLSFDTDRRRVVEEVFLRLVSVSDDHNETRRRVRRTELERAGLTSDDLDVVLREYGRHRLLTFDRDPASRTPTVELAHEALLTEWERFAAWIDAAREDLLARRRLETATCDWLGAGMDPSFLYRGGRLELAESWAAESRLGPSDAERTFLTASRNQVVRERAGRARRRRLIAGAIAAAAAAATLLAAVVVVQRRDADRVAEATLARDLEQAREAEARETELADQARARELAGLATLAVDEDPERAMLLGLAAVEASADPPIEALGALHRATQASRLARTIDGVMGASIDVSRDGSTVLADRLDHGGFVLVDVATGSTVSEIATSHQISEIGLAFDPTAGVVAAAFDTSTATTPAIELYDARSGRVVGALDGPAGYYCCSLQFDATGRWLAALTVGADDVRAVVWDVAARGDPIDLGPAFDVELLGDGTAVVGNAGKLTVVDLTTGEDVRELDLVPTVDYWELEVDPSGRLAAVVSPLARRVDVYDLTTGDQRAALRPRGPGFAQFSQDGTRLAVADDDGIIRLYDTDGFVERVRLAGTPGQPWMLFFSPDGQQLISAVPGEIRVWNVSSAGPAALGNFEVPGELIDRLAIAADERVAFATTYVDSGVTSSISRVDLTSGTADEPYRDLWYFFSTRPLVSPDLSSAAIVDLAQTTHLQPLDGGDQTSLGPCESVRAFDPSGGVAVIDSELLCTEIGQAGTGRGRIVDLATDDVLLDLGDTAVYLGAVGPPGADGQPGLAAIASRDDPGTLTFYDLASGAELDAYVSNEGDWPLSVAISADCTRVALLMSSGGLIVLDADEIRAGVDMNETVVVDIVAHNAGSKAAAFSGSGLIATGSSADGIKIWSPDGSLVAQVPTHQADDPTFTFAPGTDTLYYEDGHGLVRRFEIDLDAQVETARSLLTRDFTPQECARYFADDACPTFD